MRNYARKVLSHLNNLIGPCVKVQIEKLYIEPLFLTGQDMVDYANSHFVNKANNLTAGLHNSQHYNFVSAKS